MERLFSACAHVLTARRRRMQDKTHAHLLEIHSQALKHDVDIPDNLGARHPVSDSRQ